jgi:hypothetical protein
MTRMTLLKTFAAERSKITKPGIFALGVACIAASIVAAPIWRLRRPFTTPALQLRVQQSDFPTLLLGLK